MVYQFRSQFQMPKACDPQQVGEALEALRVKHGVLLAADVVKAARPKSSPMHEAFEWDDKAAADHYRLHQAGRLIRAVVVIRDESAEEEQPVRAFVSVTPAHEDRPSYTSIGAAMEDPGLRAQVLEAAWRELQAWRKKYDDMKELAAIFAAIDATTGHAGKDAAA